LQRYQGIIQIKKILAGAKGYNHDPETQKHRMPKKSRWEFSVIYY
jgi:hypothetical protein